MAEIGQPTERPMVAPVPSKRPAREEPSPTPPVKTPQREPVPA